MRPYREGKGHLYEGGIRVPFIMKWPGHINPGTISNRPTRTEDIYATIVDIVGSEAKPNKSLDGRTLVRDFKNSPYDAPDMYWYYPHYAPQGNIPGAAIISGDYKYLEFYDPNKNELYNLADDPGETNDLSNSMPEKIIELRGKLNKWLHDVNPILHTANPKHRDDE